MKKSIGKIVKSFMRKLFGASWRTSIWGYIIACGYATLSSIAYGGVTGRDILLAVGFAILGRAAKDARVTGAEGEDVVGEGA